MDQSVDTQIALVQKDIAQIGTVLAKLETVVEKIGDVTSSLKQLLVVHESKINVFEKMVSDIAQSLTEHEREDYDHHERVQMNFDKLETVMSKNDVVRNNDIIAIKTTLENIRLQQESNISKLEAIERWRWMIQYGAIGAAIAAGAAFNKLELLGNISNFFH